VESNKIKKLKKQLLRPDVRVGLREEGVSVRSLMKNVKKTFHLRETVLERFLRVQEHLGYRVKDALEEALSDWVEKNQSKKK
jgi:hypothetical protein